MVNGLKWLEVKLTKYKCKALEGGGVGECIHAVVGRCRLTPGFRSWPHACFQLLKLKYEKLLSSFAFNCNLRPYTVGSCSIAISAPEG